jgi:predicted transcriptional regulator
VGEFVAISDLVETTTDIVVAFISSNYLPMSEAPNLIETVHAAVSVAAGQGQGSAAIVDAPAPAVSIRNSVTPDYLICLDDGKRYKSLRRHVALLGMTPEQYRAKWKLPPDYPMVAANYAAKRSEMAKSYGFGRKRTKAAANPLQATAQRKPGRPRKATA